MDKMVFLAMSGAKQLAEAQAINNNNLANASTTGFRQDFLQVRSMPLFGEVHPSRVFAMVERPGSNFERGGIDQTGRDLDVSVRGEGWLAVQGQDGTEGYTRSGNLRISTEGLLTTNTGLPVLGDGGPIAIPPADKIEIGQDGTISIIPKGSDDNTLVAIERLKLVNPDIKILEKGNDGLFRQNNGQIAEPDADVTVQAGSLESSNVNIVDSMVKMIELSRMYDMQVKMMQTAKKTDEASTKIVSV
jgi:flagellar basal-body rod protein FlgF